MATAGCNRRHGARMSGRLASQATSSAVSCCGPTCGFGAPIQHDVNVRRVRRAQEAGQHAHVCWASAFFALGNGQTPAASCCRPSLPSFYGRYNGPASWTTLAHDRKGRRRAPGAVGGVVRDGCPVEAACRHTAEEQGCAARGESEVQEAWCVRSVRGSVLSF